MSIAWKLAFLFVSLGLLGHAVKSAPAGRAPGGIHAADDGNPFPPKP